MDIGDLGFSILVNGLTRTREGHIVWLNLAKNGLTNKSG